MLAIRIVTGAMVLLIRWDGRRTRDSNHALKEQSDDDQHVEQGPTHDRSVNRPAQDDQSQLRPMSAYS